MNTFGFACPVIATGSSENASTREISYGGMVLIAPDAQSAKRVFDSWINLESMVTPDFSINKATGKATGRGKMVYADVISSVAADDIQIKYGRSGIVRYITVVMRMKNLLTFYALGGVSESSAKDDYYRQEAERLVQSIIIKTR